MILLLTTLMSQAQDGRVAAQSATGIGVPNQKAHQRPSTDVRRFFVACVIVAGDCLPALRRAVCGGRKAHRFPFDRHANRASSATPIGVGAADPTSQKDPFMSHDTQAASSRIAAFVAHHSQEIHLLQGWTHSNWCAWLVKREVVRMQALPRAFCEVSGPGPVHNELAHLLTAPAVVGALPQRLWHSRPFKPPYVGMAARQIPQRRHRYAMAVRREVQA